MSEKPRTKMYVVATKFTLFLLLLLISHIISLLWTGEPGGKKKVCYGAAGLSETEYRECHFHTTD